LRKKRLKQEQRKSAISILRGISIRMPMMIYGTELKDDEDVTLDNFTDKIDPKSWEEFMPYGVTKQWFNKIKQYYDPDIFLESGRVIRRKTMEADNLPIRERIRKIVDIFNTFKNPDKETVLTPWRVVNMQLSDTMGGYSFYDKKFEGRLDEPRFIDRGSVTNRVFADKESKILELNSKSGLYPLYMAYSLYRERCKEYERIGWYSIDDMTIDQQLDTWDNVLHHNVFVVCKTKMAETITKRTLSGYRKSVANTKCFDNLIDTLRNEPETFIKKVVDGKNYWKINRDTKMKFNAIVGNPPYQEMDGGSGASAKPIYQHFVEIAKKLNPQYISLIMPAKWFAGGKGLDEFRFNMLSDKHISYIMDFVNAKDCFPTASIAGGVLYMLWDQKHNNKCSFKSVLNGQISEMDRDLNEFPVFVRYNVAIDIIHKVMKITKDNISSLLLSRNPFGLPSYERGSALQKNKSDFKLLSSVGYSYIPKNKILDNISYATKWKVSVSKVTNEHAGEPDKTGMFKLLSSLNVLDNNTVCTDSYLIIGKFDNEKEATNLRNYLATKFVRFLLLQAVSSINLSKDKFQFVPMQDFTQTWTDKKLYKKCGLTEEEIGYIENIIKPMDDKASTTANDDTQAEMDL